MPQNLIALRTELFSTDEFCATVLKYASVDLDTKVFLSVSQRYSEAKELPTHSKERHQLLQNSPVLLAAVVIILPAVRETLNLVLDVAGVTMQRPQRAAEVGHLLKELLASGRKNVGFGRKPIEATEGLSAGDAARVLLNNEFVGLDKESVHALLALLEPCSEFKLPAF